MGKSLGSTEPTARLALHFYHSDDGGGHNYYYITTPSVILVPFTLLGSLHPIMLSALSQSRGQRRSFIKCVTSPRGFVRTGVLFQFLSACFSRRHCCRNSWRWREEEVPKVCHCCPGLFEYGALGRGHWPTAAHPRGPPCDKPGNVEWRPVRQRGERKRFIISGPTFLLLSRYHFFSNILRKRWSTFVPHHITNNEWSPFQRL